MSHYIYTAKNEAMPKYVKIGITKDVPSRERSLNSGTKLPEKTEIFYAVEVKDEPTAKKIETVIKTGLRDLLRRADNTEWFLLEHEYLAKIVSIAEIMGGTKYVFDSQKDNESLDKKNIFEEINTENTKIMENVIIVSAQQSGFERVFMEQGQWWSDVGLKIDEKKIHELEYLAVYVSKPIQKITHYGKIKSIIPDDNPNRKYENAKKIILEDKPKPIENGPVILDQAGKHVQDKLYTNLEKLFIEKKLSKYGRSW